ncbi:hypothetical protein FS837_005813, partial [Tulasnella sp. UAMH 9824]
MDALHSTTLRVHFTLPAGTTGTVTDINIVAELQNAANAPYAGLAAGDFSGTVATVSEPARMVGTAQ